MCYPGRQSGSSPSLLIACLFDKITWNKYSSVTGPRNGYLVISRNTKLDEIKQFFRGISAEFREIPRKDFAKISHIVAKYFGKFRGISRNFVVPEHYGTKSRIAMWWGRECGK
jgi:hypothetical protein